MKTKLIALVWRGHASVDPRFSAAMLPWTISDICTRESYEKLSVGIDNGVLETYNCDFELQFAHQLKYIVGMCKVTARRSTNGLKNKFTDFSIVSTGNKSSTGDGTIMQIVGPQHGIVYLMKDPRDPLLHIYLFESDCIEEMTELMHQMRDPSQTLGGSVGSIPASFVSSGSNDMSLQKALQGQGVHSTPASNLKQTEAVRFAQHDGSPSLTSTKMASSKSYTSGLNHSAGTVCAGGGTSSSTTVGYVDISPNNTQFFEVMYVGKIKVSHKRVPYTFIDDALPKFKAYDAQKIKLQTEAARRLSIATVEMDNLSRRNSNDSCSDEDRLRMSGDDQKQHDADPEEFKDKILNTKLNEENKENSLPTKRKLLRGQSQVVLPVINDVPKQRDRSASIGSVPLAEQNRTMVFLIGKTDLRLISPDRKQVLLYKDLKDVASCAQGHKSGDHFGIICREQHSDGYIGYVFKCKSESVADDIVATISQAFLSCSKSKSKENQIFSCEHCPMLWYHKLCADVEGMSEKKTQTVIFRRIDLLSEEEQNVIWAKYYGAEEMADHSMGEQNQFLMMLLRAHCESRQQRHVHDTAENRSEFLNQYLGGSTIFMKAKRSLTSSFDHLLKRKNSKDDFAATVKEVQSKDNSTESGSKKSDSDGIRPRTSSFGSTPTSRSNSEQLKSPMMDIFIKVGNSPKESQNHASSWRQEMLNRVVTPSKNADAEHEYMSPRRHRRTKKQRHEKRSTEELRQLWRTAIRQTILLARMEKENARLQARHDEHELKKIKLDYDEIIPCDKQAVDHWETFIGKQLRISNKRDPKVLLQAIKTGVPRSARGDIWMYLADQFSMNTAPVDVKEFPNFDTPYKVLLKSLTDHQHAIFIDLGRTFPNHLYYKASLGVGQLALFNILKAYSILDPELGYCQGLGFICGVLLLHCEEEEAFNLLKHLMFRRQMRTKYLPDMKQFQLQLYQLSRLVRDHIPDLYTWLDENDVPPTLYAAPWILTVFSSQFPLGFVTRVFDLLFLESPEVIFKVAVALLDIHKDELLKRDNFEEIMDYIKNVIPQVDAVTLDRVMKDVFSMDIRKQLSEYQVEYNVLQEEITTTNHHLESLNREKENNHHLETQLQFAQSSIAQLEKTRSSQQNQIQALQTQVQSLEVTVEALGQYLSQLVDKNHEIEMPGDVRRIVQHIQSTEPNRKKPIFVERKIGKSMSVNSQLGFPLKVLEELNENQDKDPASPIKSNKTPFFENTYQQIRQQSRMRPTRLDPSDTIKLPEHIEKAIENLSKSPKDMDSGISMSPMTPMSPPSQALVIDEQVEDTDPTPPMHPFSNCEDVNFTFNGTTQLKSIRSHHGHQSNTAKAAKSDATQSETSHALTPNGRS
ncbi:hypothetical protein HA402_009713 [Bradysia odoriphaga]|nr:hypothetical protein HA402_009713 [Bradysia odoriphaga]